MKHLILVLTIALFTFQAAPAFAADAAAPKADVAAVAPATKVVPAPTAEEVPKVETPAPQAEVQQVLWWEVLVKHGVELGFLILTLMATAFVRVLGKKYGFAAYTDQINAVLAKATSYAEQKAIAAAKLEEGKVTSSAEKMKMAINFAQKLGKDYKIKNKSEEWWEDHLEAWLGVDKK